MKVSAEQKARNRKAILATAARLLRTRGPDGLGVAEVMEGAGLTHGGFYGHFSSKEHLAVETVAKAMQEAAAYASDALANGGLKALSRSYLDRKHLKEVANGCPIAATLSEIARQPQTVREAFAAGLRTYLDAASRGEDRKSALAYLAGMIGALALARAVSGEDKALAEEIMAAARDSVSSIK